MMDTFGRRLLCWIVVALLCLFVKIKACPTRCLCFRTTVRCMFLQLESIPEVPAQTTILDLRFNRIRDIPRGAFRELRSLNTLLLNNNHIQRIRGGVFEGMSELRYLYLYKNHISEIDRDAFHGLPNLEQLYIHFNKIEEMHPETFSKLTSLERLFLHNNKLRTLPYGVFSNLEHLRRLRLDSNAFVCDCQMMWLKEMITQKRDHTQAAATCEYPNRQTDSAQNVVNIEEAEFHCKKPEIVLEPTDLDVQFGTTAYLTCRAAGDPQPEITWLHNNVAVIPNTEDESSRFNVLNDGTLMIEDTRDIDQGVYECIAKNAAGEAKTNAVEVKYQGSDSHPTLREVPETQEAGAGSDVTLPCAVSGHPRPVITWVKDGQELPTDTRFSVSRTGTLTITSIQYDDRGHYTCAGTNRQGSVSASARIYVSVGPTFTERPQDQTVLEGGSVVFLCRAEGIPTPQLTWLRNGRPVDASNNRIVITGSTLRISPVEKDDEGFYDCLAENDAGRELASAELTVPARIPPSFIRTPSDNEIHQGGNVELYCEATGDPRPEIRWFQNNNAVSPNNRRFISEQGDLAILNLTLADDGVYECLAENPSGIIRTYARLAVLERGREYVGDRFVNVSIHEAIETVNRAINNTLREIMDPNRRRTPSDLLTLFRLPRGEALEITRAAEVFERTIEIVLEHVQQGHQFNFSRYNMPYRELISPSHLAIIANLSNCATHRRVEQCQDMCYHHKYRTFDGTCNNLQHPMWGASLTPFKRLIPPRYENGFNTPVGWNTTRRYNGYTLPSARYISLQFVSTRRVSEDERFTHMVMQWGQFMDHDIDFAPMAASNARFSDGRYCNETCENQAPCFPIPVPEGDPRIRRHRCMGMTRSSAMCGSGMTSVFFTEVLPREQMNQITSYIDASNVYGSSEEESYALRDFQTERGLLQQGQIMASGKALLPPALNTPVDCQIDPNMDHVPCFLAGDHRVNEQLGLLSMHTIWMREHNRIVQEFLLYNQHWDGDMLFHETRKLVGAQLQHITYKHWLPKFIGKEGMDLIGEYKGYDPNVDVSVMNSFATAAYRIGHTLINPTIFRLNETFQPIPQGDLPLHMAFFAPFRIVEEGGIDPVLRGLYGVPMKKLQAGEYLNEELTEKLFKLAHEVALDLAALNIQRGRDHGLPAYNAFREKCGLRPANRWEDLRRQISNPTVRRRLREIYGHPGNLDLFVGGIAEDPAPGTLMGPTFRCIIAEQFKRLRDGDRFWYENPGVFKPAQLVQIKQTNLARVICNNADDIRRIQKDVFLMADFPTGYSSCDSEEIPHIDLKVWTDCCTGPNCGDNGEFNSIAGSVQGRRKRRSTDFAEFSYPEDRPLTDVQNSIEHLLNTEPDDPVFQNVSNVHSRSRNQKVAQDATATHDHQHQVDNISGNASAVIKEKMHSMMDVMDTRIEGVEGIMSNLQRTVHKLNKKIRKLERRLAASQLDPTSCVDGYGKERKNSEKWKIHDCKSCVCKEGQLECSTETCQIPSCNYPKKIAGVCCPVC